MNHQDAIRNLGNPGYTPTKGTIRILNTKYYLCTFQNTETDQGGGHYLAQGEYTRILPGRQARHARDARLNHLNAIREYQGEIWQVTGINGYQATLHPTQADAEAERDKQAQRNAADAEKAFAHIDKEINWTDAEMLDFYGKCYEWPGNETEKIAEHRAHLANLRTENEAYWQKPIKTERIR